MRVPLRLERSAALFVSMHFASFGGQGSKVLVGSVVGISAWRIRFFTTLKAT